MTGCSHPNSEIRRRPLQNGAVQFIGQCLDCGRTVGTARRHETINNKSEVAVFDEELIGAEWRAKLQEREIENRKWWSWYNEYLTTDAWAKKRAAVFQRENGICQGCRQKRATQAHHLTYKHVGNELLFDLIALCENCHVIAHAED